MFKSKADAMDTRGLVSAPRASVAQTRRDGETQRGLDLQNVPQQVLLSMLLCAHGSPPALVLLVVPFDSFYINFIILRGFLISPL